jgi:hypothetical protein
MFNFDEISPFFAVSTDITIFGLYIGADPEIPLTGGPQPGLSKPVVRKNA